MKAKNTISTTQLNLVDYIADETSLLLINASPRVDIITVEPETMGIMNRYSVETVPHLYSEAITDDNCIYLPTKVGHILAIDKFSGQILDNINLGLMHITSDLKQKQGKMYCIAGVPISTRHKTRFDRYCLIICDIQAAKKEIQSRYFEGNPSFISLCDKEIWIVGNTHLLKFSLEGELLGEVDLEIVPAHPPLITSTHSICVSKEGDLKVMDRSDLAEHASFKTRPCLSPPLNLNSGLTWITDKGICIVDIDTKVFRTIETNRTMSEASAALNSSTIIGGDTEGFLLTFDIDANTVDVLKISDSKLMKPVIVEDFLFIASESNLHQIEVKDDLQNQSR